ncbi:hypothetical protein P168DRAFT_174800 [Aspergillus campestris IBT 28561]|uniref:BTB domain-containing protein n=1 Tax=Aspergillus campestris (strain IBT 28561) TaxID=1392248 RepID=A0A2I1CZB2_ASPC2|nr:uncharacterized protein P168DRAFT_174800 [Aspergillus campestris IBT 28561]PKY02970.1 hypothetical protein P168DRAFT_174800 [Aspergillus campestris IBT 28561]
MDPCTSSSFFAEPPIRIRVGSDKKTYYAHRQALSAYTSSALHARVTGPWQECGEEEIDWTDFDEQTISCVLQFLYTQEYNVRKPVQLLEKSPQSDAGKGQGHPGSQADGGPSDILATVRAEHTVAKRETQEQQAPEADELEYNELGNLINRPLTPLRHYFETSLPVKHNPTTGGNSSQTTYEGEPSELLLHAKVYSFAHRYLVDNLVQYVLQRLKKTLITIQKKQLGFCPQLAESISLIYGATSAYSAQGDPARNLLSQFVALNYTAMYGSRLEELLAEGGQFTIDLSWKLARRLMSNPLEEKLDELSTAYESLQAESADKDREIECLTRQLKEWDDWNASRPLSRRRWMPPRNNGSSNS